MVSIGRILRDYRDAGSVNGLLALWGFVDDTTFLTKSGHVGVAYRLRGVDYEGLSHPQRQALAHRFEAVHRGVDLFDSVMPARVARNGQLWVPGGRLNIRNQRYLDDPGPIQEDCPCLACQRFSRAYLAHPVLGPRLRDCARLVAGDESAVRLVGPVDERFARESDPGVLGGARHLAPGESQQCQ